MATSDVRRAIEAVWRIESTRLVAGLARRVRDLALAEELAHDALVAALEAWPTSGIPARPGAWLMTVARRRAANVVRHAQVIDKKLDDAGRALAADLSDAAPSPPDADPDDERGGVDDDVLRLVLTACHPVLPREGRVALTLRLVAGLTTEEIARAFLVPVPTMYQRITRAKRTLSEAGVPFEVPRGDALIERLGAALEVVYLVFNEGYAATSGDAWIRPTLCQEALRLGRMLAALAPDVAEVHGLVALMELDAARLPARVGPTGEPVLLLDQDRSRWDRLLLRRGLAGLTRAEALAAPGRRGPYTLQAAIAACHARARVGSDTDWVRIAALYTALVDVLPSPVVELNRAVALGLAFGPAAGLEVLAALEAVPALARYAPYHAARGELLARAGDAAEAARAFARAAEHTTNPRERDALLRRAGDVGRS